MQWQDIIFTVGGWVFIIALIPTLRGKQKPELSSSIITSVILVTFGATYITLGLILSAISTFGVSVGWAILAYQRYTNDKKGLTVVKKK